jgi:hypothetical protein
MTPATIVHVLPCASTMEGCASIFAPFTEGVAANAVDAEAATMKDKNTLAMNFIDSTPEGFVAAS